MLATSLSLLGGSRRREGTLGAGAGAVWTVASSEEGLTTVQGCLVIHGTAGRARLSLATSCGWGRAHGKRVKAEKRMKEKPNGGRDTVDLPVGI